MQFRLLLGVLDEEVEDLFENAFDYMGTCSLDWVRSAHDVDDLSLLEREVQRLA